MVIVALRKVFQYPLGYSRNLCTKTSSGKEKTVYNSGSIGLGVLCLRIWNTVMMMLTRKIKKAEIKKNIISLPLTSTLNVADVVEPRVCVSVKNQ